MSRFRKLKGELRERLGGAGWRACLDELSRAPEPLEYVGPLTALLPQGGILRWRGVQGLGVAVPALAAQGLEEGRVVLRRLMWHLNEESGNLGWGVPESMGEILSNSPPLAAEFHRVLFSYILDSGREDNYLDYPPLLRGCFWGAGRLAQARPDLGSAALPSFVHGLEHEDAPTRGQACLALGKLLAAAPEPGLTLGELRARAGAALEAMRPERFACEDFDGENILYIPAGVLAGRCLDLLGPRSAGPISSCAGPA